jgi:hypothetical protein
MPLALGMFALAIMLVGVVSVAKARGALPQTKFSIGQKVAVITPKGPFGATVVSITLGNPVRYDVTPVMSTGVMTNVPESQITELPPQTVIVPAPPMPVVFR